MLAGLIRLIRRRIVYKLTLTLVGFVALTMLAAGFYLTRELEGLAVEALEARLATATDLLLDEAARLLGRGASPTEFDRFARRVAGPSGSRVTIMALDGRVLADSEVPVEGLARVENHATRPEMQAALAGRRGRNLRRSVTVNAPLLYVATPVRFEGGVVGVVRMALPLSVVTSSSREIHRVMLIGGLLALAAAVGIGVFVAARVTWPVVQMEAIARRMSEGQFGARAPVRSPDEIGALGRALNVMAARLRDRIDDLQREQAKVAAILDGMVEGVVAVDGRDQIVLMNERARAMFGVGAARADGKPFLEVIRNADLHDIVRASRAEPAGSVLRREVPLATPLDRAVQINAVPLRLGGEEAGVVVVIHDITELRRLEQVRTEFVANVSHELRTPLTAIRGYLETLLGGAMHERENAQRFLEIAFRHAERLGRLVDDLMDLSNIELGRVQLRLEPTRLADVVDSVAAIMGPRAEQGRVALTAALPADLPHVIADHDRVVQILLNLVDNAVKYTGAGGQVTVSARALADGRVEVAVADTGVGIPRADLPRITERFYRVDRARSRELGGTGLGLAIVKHLVTAHGGELTIESDTGRGTVVRFMLLTEPPALHSRVESPVGEP